MLWRIKTVLLRALWLILAAGAFALTLTIARGSEISWDFSQPKQKPHTPSLEGLTKQVQQLATQNNVQISPAYPDLWRNGYWWRWDGRKWNPVMPEMQYYPQVFSLPSYGSYNCGPGG